MEDRRRPGVINREDGAESGSAASSRRDEEPAVASLDEAAHARAGTERETVDGPEAAARIDHEDRAVVEIAATLVNP